MWTADICPVYKCCLDKAVEHCGKCGEMPCERWTRYKDPNVSEEEGAAEREKRAAFLRQRKNRASEEPVKTGFRADFCRDMTLTRCPPSESGFGADGAGSAPTEGGMVRSAARPAFNRCERRESCSASHGAGANIGQVRKTAWKNF